MNQKEETKNFYNKIADQSFIDWFNNPSLLPTLTVFMQHLPKNPLVLDLGCGTGGESKRLFELGAQVTGIDFSEKSLDYAKRNVPDASFILMDILKMDFQDGTYDGVVEAGVLFHFTSIEQDKILSKIYSILKPSGIFLSYYPAGEFEGIQELNVSGELIKRFCRLLPTDIWISQVMNNDFRKFIKHDYNIKPFQCVEFFK